MTVCCAIINTMIKQTLKDLDLIPTSLFTCDRLPNEGCNTEVELCLWSIAGASRLKRGQSSRRDSSRDHPMDG